VSAPPSPREWLVWGSPRPHQPLISAVERYAAGLRSIAAELTTKLTLTAEEFEVLWGPKSGNLGFCGPRTSLEASSRGAWCLIAQWLLGVVLEEVASNATLAEAHRWFVGEADDLPSIDIPRVEPARHGLAWTTRSEPFGLLPYLLDPAAPATRRDVLKGLAAVGERSGRKSLGVYFTPQDAAHFMVQGIGEHQPPSRVLDPAVGSGVFLRAVVAEFPTAEVFGIDINPSAAEMATFTLMSVCRSNESAWHEWHRLRLRLATGDTLTLQPAASLLPFDASAPIKSGEETSSMLGAVRSWRLAEAFPALADGVDAIVQNPPYSACPPERRQAVVSRWGAVPRNVYPLFLRTALEQLTPSGRMAAVVPASVLASSAKSVLEARIALLNAKADIEILSFDRAPDGLFGDDVKTRCSIVFCDRRRPARLRVSRLIRITSGARSAALRRNVGVEVPMVELAEDHPARPGSSEELILLCALRKSPRRLAQNVLATRSVELGAIQTHATDAEVLLGPTAYNWLNVQRHSDAAQAAGHDSGNVFLGLTCADAAIADAVYAVLSSRVSLWAWRTFGDGFHVSRWLLDQLPGLPEDRQTVARLSELGAKLWIECRERPVTSLNGGRTTAAFPPNGLAPAERLLSKVDRLVLDGLKLSDSPVNLASWAREIAAVGRTEERTGAVPWSEAS